MLVNLVMRTCARLSVSNCSSLSRYPDSRHHEEKLNYAQKALKRRQPAPKRISVGYEDRTVRGID
jgi:hypothetical protein